MDFAAGTCCRPAVSRYWVPILFRSPVCQDARQRLLPIAPNPAMATRRTMLRSRKWSLAGLAFDNEQAGVGRTLPQWNGLAVGRRAIPALGIFQAVELE